MVAIFLHDAFSYAGVVYAVSRTMQVGLLSIEAPLLAQRSRAAEIGDRN